MSLKIVYNISSYHNISFDHDIETEDLEDLVGANVIEDFKEGKISENDLLNIVWDDNKEYINDLLHQHVEIDLRLEED